MTSIDAAMTGATYDEVVEAMQGMIAGGLAFANGEDIDLTRRAEVYALVLNVIPPDILTSVALQLVASEQFFPSAATWLKACDRPLAERQRMKQRIGVLIGDHDAAKAKAEEPREEPHVRLAGMIASYTRHGMAGRAAAHQATLYAMAEAARRDSLDVPAWANGAPIVVKLSDGVEYAVFANPPPADAPAPEPLPGGIVEPPPPVPVEYTRTPTEAANIAITQKSYQAIRDAGLPVRTDKELPPIAGMVDDLADYADAEPAGDE